MHGATGGHAGATMFAPLVTAPPQAGFRHVLCAVDGSPGSDHVAEQAAALVDPGGSLTVLTAAEGRSAGRRMAALDAAHVLTDELASRARRDGLSAGACVTATSDPARAVVNAAAEFDLLVVGTHDRSRAEGILLGSVPTRALHEAPVPVVVARHHDDLDFPGPVLAACAGQDDDQVAEVAGALAARHRAPVVLTFVGAADAAIRHALARQAVRLAEITGVEPVVVSTPGDPAVRLAEIALSTDAGLLITGSRRRRGLSSLASVSERVAHRARCSVLVLRATP